MGFLKNILGMKRNYRDDSYEEGYEPQSSYRGGSGDYYDDQRDSKRGMFDRCKLLKKDVKMMGKG